VYLDLALERSPDKPLIVLRRALLAEIQKDYTLAEEYLDHALATSPEFETTQKIVREYNERKKARQ
jgi:DNA-binding phage protein